MQFRRHGGAKSFTTAPKLYHPKVRNKTSATARQTTNTPPPILRWARELYCDSHFDCCVEREKLAKKKNATPKHRAWDIKILGRSSVEGTGTIKVRRKKKAKMPSGLSWGLLVCCFAFAPCQSDRPLLCVCFCTSICFPYFQCQQICSSTKMRARW